MAIQTSKTVIKLLSFSLFCFFLNVQVFLNNSYASTEDDDILKEFCVKRILSRADRQLLNDPLCVCFANSVKGRLDRGFTKKIDDNLDSRYRFSIREEAFIGDVANYCIQDQEAKTGRDRRAELDHKWRNENYCSDFLAGTATREAFIKLIGASGLINPEAPRGGAAAGTQEAMRRAIPLGGIWSRQKHIIEEGGTFLCQFEVDWRSHPQLVPPLGGGIVDRANPTPVRCLNSVGKRYYETIKLFPNIKRKGFENFLETFEFPFNSLSIFDVSISINDKSVVKVSVGLTEAPNAVVRRDRKNIKFDTSYIDFARKHMSSLKSTIDNMCKLNGLNDREFRSEIEKMK